jgi:hypothetical protein
MSKIESSVKPILISMLECVSSIHISANDSMIVAWWIYKTALTLHSASPYGSIIPQQHYEMALKQIAPPNFMIAIAHCVDKIGQPSWIQNQNWTGLSQFVQATDLQSQTKNTYRITFGFGNFVARVHYFPLRYRLFDMEQDAIHYLHPRRKDGFQWTVQSTIQSIYELDQSILVSRDPNQDVEMFKRGLELSLNHQNDDNYM